jgi:hypothetical protein
MLRSTSRSRNIEPALLRLVPNLDIKAVALLGLDGDRVAMMLASAPWLLGPIYLKAKVARSELLLCCGSVASLTRSGMAETARLPGPNQPQGVPQGVPPGGQWLAILFPVTGIKPQPQASSLRRTLARYPSILQVT